MFLEVLDHVVRELFIQEAGPDLGCSLFGPREKLPQEGERSRPLLDRPVLEQLRLCDWWKTSQG